MWVSGAWTGDEGEPAGAGMVQAGGENAEEHMTGAGGGRSGQGRQGLRCENREGGGW